MLIEDQCVCLYETAPENVFITITDITIMSSAYFFYLKKRCKKIGRNAEVKTEERERRDYLWGLVQVQCRHFKGKEFDLFSLFQS